MNKVVVALLLMAVALLAALFTSEGQAKAQLIAGQDIIAAPASIIDDPPGATNDHQQAFDERQCVKLTAPLDVDGGSIAAGTLVDSHMIFLNTEGTTNVSDQNVAWTFDGAVLGVMSDVGGTLEAASSALLGAVGTTYPAAFPARGLESDPLDNYTVAANAITVGMHVTEPGDWIRVVTASNCAPCGEDPPLDSDGDCFKDFIEEILGSDPKDPGSTPETGSLPETCADGRDNDRDGRTDADDPGCARADLAMTAFPPAGTDCFDSVAVIEITLFANGNQHENNEVHENNFDLEPLIVEVEGPVLVERGDPDPPTGPKDIPTEIVSMSLTGESPFGPITVTESPTRDSMGMIMDGDRTDDTQDFPADSFFDVFFEIDTLLGRLHNEERARVGTAIESIPPTGAV